jgi:hypothetical protein
MVRFRSEATAPYDIRPRRTGARYRSNLVIFSPGFGRQYG